MATLDVSDLLDDPEWSDFFTLLRQSETVGANGRAVRTQLAPEQIVGVMQNGGRRNTIGPDGALVTGDLNIWTKTHLRVATDTAPADRLLWAGTTYTVTMVEDWSRFGYYKVTANQLPTTEVAQ